MERTRENARADILKRRIDWYVTRPSTPRETHSPSIVFGRNSPRKVGVKRSQLASQYMNGDFWGSMGCGCSVPWVMKVRTLQDPGFL